MLCCISSNPRIPGLNKQLKEFRNISQYSWSKGPAATTTVLFCFFVEDAGIAVSIAVTRRRTKQDEGGPSVWNVQIIIMCSLNFMGMPFADENVGRLFLYDDCRNPVYFNS